MLAYTTMTTARGTETYLLRGDETVAVFVANDHAEAAAEVAMMLNERHNGE